MPSSEGFACGSRPVVVGSSRCRKGLFLEKTGDERRKNMATRIGTGTKSQRIEPLTKRKAWKARQTYYKQVGELHLRSAGVHRLRCGPDGLLGSARQLACQEDHSGGRGGRDRPP